MAYLVHLDAVELTLSIGIHEHERRAPQPVQVWVSLVIDGDADHIWDYDALHDFLRSLEAEGHIELQEQLLARIVGFCQAAGGDAPGIAATDAASAAVIAGRVRVAKTGVYPRVGSVGCVQVWGEPQALQLLAFAPKG